MARADLGPLTQPDSTRGQQPIRAEGLTTGCLPEPGGHSASAIPCRLALQGPQLRVTHSGAMEESIDVDLVDLDRGALTGTFLKGLFRKVWGHVEEC